MPTQINPVVQAIIEAHNAKGANGAPIYTKDEIRQMIIDVGLSESDIPLVQTTRSAEGTKPVTTLKTLEHEEFALEAPLGGPMQTQKQRDANAEFSRQIALRTAQRGERKE
jgi:hypothetical protein